MELSANDVQRIAHLARIELDEKELAPLHGKLRTIFRMIDDLSRVDTANVAPMAHAQPVSLPLRADQVTEPEDIASRDACQVGAPAVQDGLFLVPKVIE